MSRGDHRLILGSDAVRGAPPISSAMTTIVPLVSHQCSMVAILHMAHLRTKFKGRCGVGLLSAYYAAIAESDGACGYVAEHDGRVAGYVCGVWQPRAVQHVLIERHMLELAIWGTVHCMVAPSSLSGLVQRLSGGADRHTTNGYELRPIVVAPEVRGTGVAARLVEALLADAGRRGFESIHLLTELDNTIAHRFYLKSGFVRAGLEHHNGQPYMRYEHLVAVRG